MLLRFGLQSDKERLLELRGSAGDSPCDGLVVPLHLLEYQAASVASYVYRCGLPYFIDPVSYLLQHPVRRYRDGERVRKSIQDLAHAHGPWMGDRLERPDLLEARELTPAVLDEMVASVVHLQKVRVRQRVEEIELRHYRKYRLPDGFAPAPFPPAFLVPPYFAYQHTTDPWYRLNLALAHRAVHAAEGFDVFPVVLVPRRMLATPGEIDNLVLDYSDPAFAGLLLWLESEGSEWEEGEAHFAVEMVRRLAANGKPVLSLYGDYFAALLYHAGLAGLAHGALYAERRLVRSSVGGRPLDRYYVPRFHGFSIPARAEILVGRLPELACGCPECAPLSPRVAEMDSPALRRHFLRVRRREVEEVGARSVEQLKAELRKTYERYAVHPAVRETGVSLENLRVWVNSL